MTGFEPLKSSFENFVWVVPKGHQQHRYSADSIKCGLVTKVSTDSDEVS